MSQVVNFIKYVVDPMVNLYRKVILKKDNFSDINQKILVNQNILSKNKVQTISTMKNILNEHPR